jgi:hypothetical protein
MSLAYSIPWMIPLLVMVVGNGVVIWFLCRRLRQTFPAIWTELGSPGYPVFSTSVGDTWRQEKAMYRLFFFVCSNRHVALQDNPISRLVWCARLGYALTAFFFVLWCIEVGQF